MRPLPVNELVHCIVICVSVSELSMMREIFIVVMTHFAVVSQVLVLVRISVVVCELVMMRHAVRESIMMW